VGFTKRNYIKALSSNSAVRNKHLATINYAQDTLKNKMANLKSHGSSGVEEEGIKGIVEEIVCKEEREDKPVDSKKSFNSFTLFPELPLELRLSVWRQAYPRPRIVMVKYQFKVMPEILRADEEEFWGAEENTARIVRWIRPSAEIPLVLHVCQESRQEALMTFEAGLEVRPGGPQTYWDPMLDTVFLIKQSGRDSGSTLRPLDELPVGARVRIWHLAVDLNATTISYTDEEVKDQLLPLVGFTSLRSLTLVVDPLRPFEFQSRVIFREPLDVPIMQLLAARPTAIEQRFENILEGIRARSLDWKPPTVRVMVALWGTRKNAWCKRCKYMTLVFSSSTLLKR
jgi:2EXR family